MTKLSKLRQRKIRLVKDRKRMKRKDDIACRLAIFPMQFFNHNNRIRLVWKMRIRMFFHDARVERENRKWLRENAEDIYRGMLSSVRILYEMEEKEGDRIWDF